MPAHHQARRDRRLPDGASSSSCRSRRQLFGRYLAFALRPLDDRVTGGVVREAREIAETFMVCFQRSPRDLSVEQ